MSSSQYAAWIADKIGGEEGDVLYSLLLLRVGNYERSDLIEPMGFDLARAKRGAVAMQKSPARQTFGLLTELRIADIAGDEQRMGEILDQIEKEKVPAEPGVFMNRAYLRYLFRERKSPPAPKQAVPIDAL